MIKGNYWATYWGNALTGTCQRCWKPCKAIAKYCLDCRKAVDYELNRDWRAKRKVSKK